MANGQEGLVAIHEQLKSTVDRTKLREVGSEYSVAMPDKAFDFVRAVAAGTAAENPAFAEYLLLVRQYPESWSLYKKAAQTLKINDSQPALLKAALSQLQEELIARVNWLRLKTGEISGDDLDALLFAEVMDAEDVEEQPSMDDLTEELGILYFLLAEVVSPPAPEEVMIEDEGLVGATPSPETVPGMVTLENARNGVAFRDFAVYMKWLGPETPDKVTDPETIKLIETNFLDFMLTIISADYWGRATDAKLGNLGLKNWPIIRKPPNFITVSDFLQNHPNDKMKVVFEEHLDLLEELMAGGSKWGGIAKTASFEQIVEFADHHLLDGKGLKAIAEMNSPEQLTDHEVLSNGQLIYEGFYHYTNWGASYIELSKVELEQIGTSVREGVRTNAIRLPTLELMNRLAAASPADRTLIDLGTIDSGARDIKYLTLFWKQSTYEGGTKLTDSDHYNAFRKMLTEFLVVGEIRKAETANHGKYGLWPLELVADEKRNVFREEVSKCVGVRKISRGVFQYIPNVNPDYENAGNIIDAAGNLVTAFHDASGVEISKEQYLENALEKGRPLELMAYQMGISFLEPMIQDYLGIQGNKGSRTFDTSTYRRRKENSGSEGQWLLGLWQIRRLMLPPAASMSVRIQNPESTIGRGGGLRLKAVSGHANLLNNAVHHGGFGVMGTQEGAGQRIKIKDAFMHVEKIYKALSLGFTGVGINLFNISSLDKSSSGFFTAQAQLLINDEVLNNITAFTESTLKYWLADYYQPASALTAGYDASIWTPVSAEKEYVSPLFSHMFNFTDEKKNMILERARAGTGLERAMIIEMLKMILIESLIRKATDEISNEDATGIIYAFTGKNISRYKIKVGNGGSIASVMQLTMQDVAYCFQEAQVRVPPALYAAFRRAGGVV